MTGQRQPANSGIREKDAQHDAPLEEIVLDDPGSALNSLKRILALMVGFALLFLLLNVLKLISDFEQVMDFAEGIVILGSLSWILIYYGLNRSKTHGKLYFRFYEHKMEARFNSAKSFSDDAWGKMYDALIDPFIEELYCDMQKIREIEINMVSIILIYKNGHKRVVPLSRMDYATKKRIKNHFARYKAALQTGGTTTPEKFHKQG